MGRPPLGAQSALGLLHKRVAMLVNPDIITHIQGPQPTLKLLTQARISKQVVREPKGAGGRAADGALAPSASPGVMRTRSNTAR